MKVKAELTFNGSLKEKPIICSLCKNFDITVSILEASFSTETGWAIIFVDGEKTELQKAFEFLKNEGVLFDTIEGL